MQIEPWYIGGEDDKKRRGRRQHVEERNCDWERIVRGEHSGCGVLQCYNDCFTCYDDCSDIICVCYEERVPHLCFKVIVDSSRREGRVEED
jgi:hypothetical protein